MTNVIDLDSRRPPVLPLPPPDPLDMYCLRITRSGPKLGEVLGHEELSAEQRRRIAADLIELTRSMLGTAWKMDGDTSHNQVAEFRIMASGRVTSWVSGQVDNLEKLEWLDLMVQSLSAALPPKSPGAD